MTTEGKVIRAKVGLLDVTVTVYPIARPLINLSGSNRIAYGIW